MTDEQQLFEEIIQRIPQAELSSLFGKACGKVNKKAFVAFYQNEMVFKLGREQVDQLLETYEGAQKWDPSGKKRPMKDWLQLPASYREDWAMLANQACLFLTKQ